MDYKRKPLASFNQLPQQIMKKRDIFSKNNELTLKNSEIVNSKNNENFNINNKIDKNCFEKNKITTQNVEIQINEDKNSRIISYNCQPPSKDKEFIRSTWSNLKPISIKEVNRYIPNKPERVLDAPKIGDDYYCELLDWSFNNKVAIALDSTVYVWDATHGTINTVGNKKEIGKVCSLKWSNDEDYLGIGNETGETQIWNTNKNKKLRTIRIKTDNSIKIDINDKKEKTINQLKLKINCLSWNKSILTSATSNGIINHNDVRVENSLIKRVQAHESAVCGLEWRTDGEYLASGGNDNCVKLWDLKSSTPYMVKSDHTAAVKAIAWCPWQLNLLATGGGISDKTLRIWNITTQTNLKAVKTKSQITSIIWSNHYYELLTTHGYSTNDINVWKYPTLDCISNIKAHDSRILYSALSPDGQTVATVASDENLKFWSIFKQQTKRSYNAAFTQEIPNNTIHKSSSNNKKNHFR